jgi:hypothetical protein
LRPQPIASAPEPTSVPPTIAVDTPTAVDPTSTPEPTAIFLNTIEPQIDPTTEKADIEECEYETQFEEIRVNVDKFLRSEGDFSDEKLENVLASAAPPHSETEKDLGIIELVAEHNYFRIQVINLGAIIDPRTNKVNLVCGIKNYEGSRQILVFTSFTDEELANMPARLPIRHSKVSQARDIFVATTIEEFRNKVNEGLNNPAIIPIGIQRKNEADIDEHILNTVEVKDEKIAREAINKIQDSIDIAIPWIGSIYPVGSQQRAWLDSYGSASIDRGIYSVNDLEILMDNAVKNPFHIMVVEVFVIK